MKLCQVHCILALLGLVLGMCGSSSATQLDSRYRSLVQRARAASMGPQQDWGKLSVEDLSLLAATEADMPFGDMSAAEESEGAHLDLERSVEPGNVPPRERKAGCKNFYWKGFTSC
uniref:Somatostatin-2 n=1 Tax=Pantodon buchholzi TaxID=8276 RepID=Q90Y42_PANBU|nr:preprosomatostatin [Pantodon buchholzi]